MGAIKIPALKKAVSTVNQISKSIQQQITGKVMQSSDCDTCGKKITKA